MRSRGLLMVLVLIIALAAAVLVFMLLQGGGLGGTSVPTALPTQEVPDVEVLVARRDLAAGTIISSTEDLFRSEPVPADSVGALDVPAADQSEVLGLKLVTGLSRNQRVQRTQLGLPGLAEKVPPGQSAYPIAVSDLSGIADLISEGDLVDVLASFPVDVTYLRPGIQADAESEAGVRLTFVEDELTDTTTKVLLQNVRVLQIVRPSPATQGTPSPDQEAEPTPAAVTPDTGPQDAQAPSALTSLDAGSWIVILALDLQQVEVIKYATDRLAVINLALGPAGETRVITTTGVTFDRLVNDYGVPLPQPASVPQSELVGTPPALPTLTAPTPGAAPTPGP